VQFASGRFCFLKDKGFKYKTKEAVQLF